MYTKTSTLAVAAALIAGLGSAGTASANVYGGSGLDVDNLLINFGDPSQVTITNFSYTLTNTATLNGVPTIMGANCNGVPASNNCGAAAPRLDALPANAPGGAPARVNNAFNFFGPGAVNEFANSDSVIETAQQTNDAVSATNQIAESQLQTGSSASANAEIQSQTGFTFTFDIASNPGTLLLTFDVDPDLFAEITNEAGGGTAGANVNTSFSLVQNTGGSGEANWNPQGTAANDCTTQNGVTCSETADSQDLNNSIGTTSNNTNAAFSWDPAGVNQTAFGIQIGGLGAGTWTLALNGVTSVSVTRQPGQVPEPGTLLLLGSGLAAAGFASRRKKKA